MKINLNILNEPYIIDDIVDIPKTYFGSTDILNLKDVHVIGKVFYNLNDDVEINLKCNGIMVLADSNTLENVDYKFSFEIDDVLQNLGEEINENVKNNKNILDINELLWENIVLEVPISYSNSEEIHLKGNGWELKNENNN